MSESAPPPVAQAPAPSVSARQWRGLGLIGAILVVAFAGVSWVQSTTQKLLEESVASRTHSLTFAFGQVENEYLRLVDAMRSALAKSGAESRQDITLRYELFVSRVDQANAGEPDLLTRIGHGNDPIKRQLREFIARADRLIGEAAASDPSVAELEMLLAELVPMARALHDLSLDAYHRDAETAGRRDDAVQLQHRIAIGLTVFQSLLTLVFAVVVVRQLRLAERRQASLERLAEELRQAQVAAESASRAKSMFVANMSHELRTPFHGLLGMLTLVEGGPLSPTQKRHLRTARRSGEHLLSILNDVLDISKLDTGGVDIVAVETDLMRLFDEVQALMEPQALERGLLLWFEFAPDLPQRLLIDGKRLKQILFNLIGNAIKFTKRGHILIAVTWRVDGYSRFETASGLHDTLPLGLDPAAPTSRSGDELASPSTSVSPRFSVSASSSVTPGAPGRVGQLCVRVADTGIGMDKATLARLFQRFAQGDDSIQRRFGGTGLGLEISRTLARRMGGDLTARSELGSGSEFCVLLPAEAGFADTQPADLLGPSTQPSTLPGAVGRPGVLVDPGHAGAPPTSHMHLDAMAPVVDASVVALRVLVCDDNEVNRLLLQAYLANLGCDPVMCEDGSQAVALARCNRFDLVLMDLHMPVLDGFGATEAIRALAPRDIGPVIVAVTADPLPETRQRADTAGIDDLLPKPLDVDDIAACLRRHFPRPVKRS